MSCVDFLVTWRSHLSRRHHSGSRGRRSRRPTSRAPNSSCATPPARGAQIICLKELFNAPYFCKSQQSDRFDLAEPIPGPTTDRMQALARSWPSCSSCRSSSGRAPGSIATPPRSSTPTAALLGVYRKMHIPDDPLFNEKYYFTPGDGPGRRRAPRSGVARLPGLEDALRDDRRADLLGPVVSGGRAHHEPARRRRSCSIPPRSAGIPAKRTSGARPRSTPGGPRSARTRSPTASTSRSPNRIGHEDEPGTDGITFFGHSFICRSVRPLPRRGGREPRRSSSPTAIRR